MVLAKQNGGPGRYFFTRFFSSRRPLRRAESLPCSPARCVAPPPPSVRAGAFALRKKMETKYYRPPEHRGSRSVNRKPA